MKAEKLITGTAVTSPLQHLPKKEQPLTEEQEKLVDDIVLYISRTYLRRDKRYFRASDPTESYSLDDIKHVLVATIPEVFPDRETPADLIKLAMSKAIIEKHSDPKRKVPIYSGRNECRPGVYDSVVFDEGFACLNTWISPSYRHLPQVAASTRMLDVLLQRSMPHEQDREFFKNWLAWCLQNEDQKPTWAIILYSRNKGTGKSTLLEFVSMLFGEGNTFHCRTVDDVTGRFAAPVFEKKFVSVEEVKLPANSAKSNAMKTFITERKVAVERKGLNMRQIDQCAAFMFTTNHLPTWLEDGERRFLVIDMDHDGHAKGKEHAKFSKFIGIIRNNVFKSEKAIAAVYHGLMQHQLPEDFDPFNLPFDKLTSPVMAQLQSAGTEVQLERLEELLEREGVKAIAQDDLCKKVGDELNISANRVRHMMFDLGWTRDKKKWGGVDHSRVIWLRPGMSIYKGVLTDESGTKHQIGTNESLEPEDIDIIGETTVSDVAAVVPESDQY